MTLLTGQLQSWQEAGWEGGGSCSNEDRVTDSNSYIHTLMVVAAMQGADQHIRSSLGFSILPKDTSTWRPGELNQRPVTFKNRTLLCLVAPGDVWERKDPITVSCPRTLQHGGQGNWTSDLPITRRWLHPWATATTLPLQICVIQVMWWCFNWILTLKADKL